MLKRCVKKFKYCSESHDVFVFFFSKHWITICTVEERCASNLADRPQWVTRILSITRPLKEGEKMTLFAALPPPGTDTVIIGAAALPSDGSGSVLPPWRGPPFWRHRLRGFAFWWQWLPNLRNSISDFFKQNFLIRFSTLEKQKYIRIY